MILRFTLLSMFSVSAAHGQCADPSNTSDQLYLNCEVSLDSVVPLAVAGGDFDRDGDADFVVIDEQTNSAVVYEVDRAMFAAGNCLAAVTELTTLSIPEPPISIDAADVDRDNNLDIVVGTRMAAYIFRGDGSGDFDDAAEDIRRPASEMATIDAQAVVIADVNGNNQADLVVGDGDGNSVMVFREGGTGSFRFTGLGPVTALAAGNFNGDGDGDLAVANGVPGDITILISQSEVAFQINPSSVQVRPPSAIAAGFIDSDSSEDLVSVSRGSSQLTVLLSNLPGSTSPPFAVSNINAGLENATAVAVGQLDGFASGGDVVVASETQNAVAIFLGRGDGNFDEKDCPCTGTSGEMNRCTVASGPVDLAILPSPGDLDGRIGADIIVVSRSGRSATFLLSGKPMIVGTPTATGTPTVTPSPQPSPELASCCEENSRGGCLDQGCQACVCGLDSVCCDSEWDQQCIDIAEGKFPEANCFDSCGCPDPSPTMVPSSTAIPSATLPPTPTKSVTDTPTETPEATVTPSRTFIPTGTPTFTPTNTPEPTRTFTPTARCFAGESFCIQGGTTGCTILAAEPRESWDLALFLLPMVLLFFRRSRSSI